MQFNQLFALPFETAEDWVTGEAEKVNRGSLSVKLVLSLRVMCSYPAQAQGHCGGYEH